jgi:hypothetical protein
MMAWIAGVKRQLLPMASCVSVWLPCRPAFSSSLAFELWSDSNSSYVRVLHDWQPLLLPGTCRQRGLRHGSSSSEKWVPLDEFLLHVVKCYSSAHAQACQMPLSMS